MAGVRRQRRLILVTGAVAVAVGAFVLAAARGLQDTNEQVAASTEVAAEIIAAQDAACHRDADFRRESRHRVIAIRHILAYFVKLIPNAPVSQTAPRTARRTVRVFRTDLGKLRVLPLPNCDEIHRGLRQELAG